MKDTAPPFSLGLILIFKTFGFKSSTVIRLAARSFLISRFWISEAAVSFAQLNTEEQIRRYLLLISKLLMPYSTAKAKKDIDIFLENVP